jgi:solute carrier family 25 carnitine/acylcarnitine transporter 20/29
VEFGVSCTAGTCRFEASQPAGDFGIMEDYTHVDALRQGFTSSSIAGFVSGAVTTLLGHPLDTLKVQLQVGSLYRPLAPTVGVESESVVSTSSLVKSTQRWLVSRPAVLYRGIAPPLLTAGGVQATYFTLYEQIKALLRDNASASDMNDAWDFHRETLIAGSLAGCVISLITNPISLVKIQLQTSNNLTMWSCYKSIYNHLGLRGFYKGGGLMVAMESVGRGSYLHCYEFCKRKINNSNDESKFTIRSKMASASIAGCYSWSLVYPLDVIKSRIQCASCTLVPSSAWGTCKSIVAESGIKGLYRGLSFTIIRAIPTASVSLPLYEHCRAVISQWMDHRVS